VNNIVDKYICKYVQVFADTWYMKGTVICTLWLTETVKLWLIINNPLLLNCYIIQNANFLIACGTVAHPTLAGGIHPAKFHY
jgi:hypothetical protein